MRISLEQQTDAVVLAVIDNGVGGVPPGTAQGSRGIGNMRLRASRLGAALRIDNNSGGTSVILQLPI